MAGNLVSINPATGTSLGSVPAATVADYEAAAARSLEAGARWRMLPAPQRGHLVRELGEALRREKDELGKLVTLEAGKILAEGRGEVQEMID
ncbi:MAG: aldehyde dehydrogenase family protein, partial [Bryobacterales bacterium]|nr:aldehyde dehydrogenase family protein [Bryobacterales bacterium]